jgi:hypothetical protein
MSAAHSATDSTPSSSQQKTAGTTAKQTGTQNLNKCQNPRLGAISRTTVNFCLDAVLLVAFLMLLWTSFVLRFVFPQATGAGGWSVWGYGYDNWARMQFSVLMFLSVSILIHVMLHWSWVCGVITSRMKRHDGKPVRWEDGTRTLVGVGLIVAIVNILGILLALASLLAKPPV